MVIPCDVIGPVKLLNDRYRKLSCDKFDSEFGSVPLNPQKERSNSDKFLKLPIEFGIVPENFVPLTLKVWRDPPNGKPGRKPRTLFQDMSITDNVPMLKIL